MGKHDIAAVVTVTAIALALPHAASAQATVGDLTIIARVLSGEGLTPEEGHQAQLNRLKAVKAELDQYQRAGLEPSDVLDYERLFNEGLRLTGDVAEASGQDVAAAQGAFARSYGSVQSGHSSTVAWQYSGVEGEAGAADYVRICDAFGSNYYYIPGTETCLRINGNVRGGVSWLENTHELGSGTVVTDGGGPGKETFGGRFGDWIQRDGIGLDFRLSGDFGGASIGKLPITGVYGGYEGAWGDAQYSGNATIGEDGVTGVGYTYFEPDGAPGAIANANGFGLETSGDLSNRWNRANLGVKIAIPLGDDDSGPRVRGRIGGFYEDLVTKASGSAQLTYNGSPYAGYSQDWDLETKDRYAGLRIGTHIGFAPQFDGKLKTSIGGDLYLGYHSGEGSYHQDSLTSGTPINQMIDYSKNGFAVGAALTASASYEFAEGWKIGGKAEWSCLPDVTSFKAPQNPSEQADAGFSSQRATRLFLELRLSRKF